MLIFWVIYSTTKSLFKAKPKGWPTSENILTLNILYKHKIILKQEFIKKLYKMFQSLRLVGLAEYVMFDPITYYLFLIDMATFYLRDKDETNFIGNDLNPIVKW